MSWGRWDCEDKTERHLIAINRQPKGGYKTFKLISVQTVNTALCAVGPEGGGVGNGAYPLTKHHFQLINDIFASKLGNLVYCYLLLPCLLGYGKRLPAYQTAYILGVGGNNI